MKAVILAGGLGTRISEESHLKPKPMIEIGGRPILWHIMKMYSHHGINEFVVCLGYKGYLIKEFFANYFLHTSDVTIDIAENSVEVHERHAEPWKVTLVDTGLDTMTGGRLARIRQYLEDDTFCMTYGDGVSDVDLSALIAYHRKHKTAATVTAVRPSGRFGRMTIEKGMVQSFKEKPLGDDRWINGGFFVLEPEALDQIESDETIWERAPLENLASSGGLACYQHHGFWEAMDTLRDKQHLEELWAAETAPWAVWKNAQSSK